MKKLFKNLSMKTSYFVVGIIITLSISTVLATVGVFPKNLSTSKTTGSTITALEWNDIAEVVNLFTSKISINSSTNDTSFAGNIKVGDGGTICNTTNKGTIRYNGTDNLFQVCLGTSWQTMYGLAPTVSSVTPNQFGYYSEGNVIIVWTNFDNNVTVKFGSIGATVQWDSKTQLTVTVPVAQLNHGGTYDILITNPSGESATLADAFTYNTAQVESFTSIGSHTWRSPHGVNKVRVLVIAGGGGTANDNGGWGWAGGFRDISNYSVTPDTNYNIMVGVGGVGCDSCPTAGDNGDNSYFDTIEATGGGGGDQANSFGADSGGSWGGTRNVNGNQGTGNLGGYSPVEWYAGGSGYDTSGSAGGGGGAGQVGYNGGPDNSPGGAGGDGRTSDITGTTVWYAGGGGGGIGQTWGVGGTGGQGWWGKGGNNTQQGEAWAPNTGAGAGGGWQSGAGNDGGSGIVVVRY